MKKILFGTIATVGILGLASCSNDDAPASTGNGVTFTVKLPVEMTRGAFGDGTDSGDRADLDNLQYTVYQYDGETAKAVLSGSKAGAFPGTQDSQETLTLDLVNGHTYQVVFYADNSANTFSGFENGQMTVDYGKAASNTASEDVFVGKSDKFTVNGAYNATVTLKRPFAQLNWGTDDTANPLVVPTLSGLTAQVVVNSGLYTTLDILDNSVGNAVSDPVTFNAVSFTDLPAQEFPVEPADYRLIAMNYLLTGEGTIDCRLDISGNNGMPVTVNSAPVKPNFRTNIYGSLLTSPGNFNITVNNEFDGNLDNVVKPETAQELLNAIASPTITEIEIDKDMDLSSATNEQLTFNSHKTLTINAGATVSLGNTNVITVNNGLTLNGGGTLENASSTESDPDKIYSKALMILRGGDVSIENITFINDPDFHYHGGNTGYDYNSAAIMYFGSTNLTVKNVNMTSGEFTICGSKIATGNITIDDSRFESTSSNIHNGTYWAYALRLSGNAVLNNCEVVGVQGALSADGCKSMIINGGKYYTVNSEGNVDAFYALYITNNSLVTINGGSFWSPNKRTDLNIGGNSAVVCGDNDTHRPMGSVIIKGGTFSGKAYNHVTNEIINPAEGYKYNPFEDASNALINWNVIKN